jgi:hypothetical protein
VEDTPVSAPKKKTKSRWGKGGTRHDAKAQAEIDKRYHEAEAPVSGYWRLVHPYDSLDCPFDELLSVTPPRQLFWRCEHHPLAIDNFFAQRAECEWCCHTQELRWHHNGTHPTPNVTLLWYRR